MPLSTNNMNPTVTQFLDELQLPLRAEIEHLRSIVLDAAEGLAENIKWNGPNYSFNGADRITMRVHPPKQIQIIFHRGVQKLAPLADRLIADESGLLVWKENDRAVATFKDMSAIENTQQAFQMAVRNWVAAAG